MKVAYLAPYCKNAGVDAWLTNLIAGTRHKVGWSVLYPRGMYTAQRYRRVLCDTNFSTDIVGYLEMYMPDVVHLGPAPEVMVGAEEHRAKYGTPIVITMHGRREQTSQEMAMLSSADAVVFPSKAMYTLFESWGCCNNPRMIYHGVVDYSHLDLTPFDFREEFGIPEDYMIVGCVSRIEKSWSVVVQLANSLCDYPIAFVFAGSGGYRDEVTALQVSAATPNLHYTNGITPWSMPAFYRGIDCGLSVSPYESFGLAICEMCWESLPVVAIDGGAVVEIIGKHGVLCNNVPELANGLVAMLNKKKRKKVGRALRKRVIAKCFTARRMGQEYIDLYNAVLSGADE